jgi:hypothetical protein
MPDPAFLSQHPYGDPGIYLGYRAVPPGAITSESAGHEAAYITMDPQYAEYYARGGGFHELNPRRGKIIHDVVAPVSRPLNLDDPVQRTHFYRLMAQHGIERERRSALWTLQSLLRPAAWGPSRTIMPQELSPRFVRALQDLGYDAVYSSEEAEGRYPTLVHLHPDRLRMTPVAR